MSVSLWLAFLAGIVSFVSPCTLPLFPSYLGYITGISFHNLDHTETIPGGLRWKAFLHALCFCVGLSCLFIILGWGATWFGHFLRQYREILRIVGGVVVIVMGLSMAGVLKWKWLMQERRLHLRRTHSVSYLGSAVVGIAFAAGWTPCIGPILTSVLMLVINSPAVGTWYMVAYALGFTIPFLVLAVTLTSIRPLLRYTEAIAKIGGWLLAIMGVLLVTGRMAIIAAWLQQVTGWQGF